MKRRLGELEKKSSNTQIDQKREKELEKQVSKYRKGTSYYNTQIMHNMSSITCTLCTVNLLLFEISS